MDSKELLSNPQAQEPGAQRQCAGENPRIPSLISAGTQRAEEAAALGVVFGNDGAFAGSVALSRGEKVGVVAGRSDRREAVIAGFIASLVALLASGAGIPGVDAASPAGAGVGTVAEDIVVAGVGVIAADASKDGVGRTSLRIGAAKLIGADIAVVAIGVGLTFALTGVELTRTVGFIASVQRAGDVVVALHRGPVAGPARAHVVDGAIDEVVAQEIIGRGDAGAESIAKARGANVAVDIGAGSAAGEVAGGRVGVDAAGIGALSGSARISGVAAAGSTDALLGSIAEVAVAGAINGIVGRRRSAMASRGRKGVDAAGSEALLDAVAGIVVVAIPIDVTGIAYIAAGLGRQRFGW